MRHMIVVSLLFCGTAATGAAIAICVGLLIDRPDVVSGALYYGVRAVAVAAVMAALDGIKHAAAVRRRW